MKRDIRINTTVTSDTERQLDTIVWFLSEPWRQASRADAIAYALGLVAGAIEANHVENKPGEIKKESDHDQ